jgi:DNA polymerase I
LREEFVLNARAIGEKLNLTILERGEIRQAKIRMKHIQYIRPLPEKKQIVVQNLEEAPFVEETVIEKWLKPPWYHRKTMVIKIISREYRKMVELIRLMEREGIAEKVNPQPSPTALFLKEQKIVPMGWIGEDPWKLDLQLPCLRVARIVKEKWVRHRYTVNLEYTCSSLRKSMEGVKEEDLLSVLEEAHIIILEQENGVHDYLRFRDRPIIRERRNPVKSIYGLIELSRLSYKNLGKTAASSIGEILTEIEAFDAVKRKMIIPRYRRNTDYWRPLNMVIEVDRGGLVGTPRPGVYNNIIQLDFSSLYPSIIAHYNISPETVRKPVCRKSIVPPGSPHPICYDEKGLVPSVISRLVDRREALRSRKNLVDQERQKALKWILVASFGYLGYRNSRFGSLMAYEAVTGIARETLRTAIETSIRMGFRVVHYIIDSIFIEAGDSNDGEIERLIRSIQEKTGFRIKVEERYRKLVIPVTRNKHPHGASNRYYGITIDNRLILKGIRCFDEPPKLKEKEAKKILETLTRNPQPKDICSKITHILRDSRKSFSQTYLRTTVI